MGSHGDSSQMLNIIMLILVHRRSNALMGPLISVICVCGNTTFLGLSTINSREMNQDWFSLKEK
jgi:hypothetical protein